MGLILAMAEHLHPSNPVTKKDGKWTPVVYAVLHVEVYRLCGLKECLDSDDALKKMIQEQPWARLLKSEDDDSKRFEEFKRHYLRAKEEKYEDLIFRTCYAFGSV